MWRTALYSWDAYPCASILGMLSEGMEISEILDDYPYLERADIRAVQLLAKRNEQHNLLLK